VVSQRPLVEHDHALNAMTFQELVKLVPDSARLEAESFGQVCYCSATAGRQDPENLELNLFSRNFARTFF
jgi:hypothetical protein